MIRRLNVRNLLALVILLLAGTLTAVVVRNFRMESPEEMLEALPRNIDLSLKEISYTETRDGARRWTLVADSAAHSMGEGVTRIENIRITFYGPQGQDEITLTARRGVLHTETREVEVSGEVVVKSSRGYALYTEELAYREAERVIRSEAPVRLVSDQAEVTGTGLRLDVEKRTVELLTKVRARIDGAAKGTKKG
jgi:LPS export ABC transporter protein LptC